MVSKAHVIALHNRRRLLDQLYGRSVSVNDHKSNSFTFRTQSLQRKVFNSWQYRLANTCSYFNKREGTDVKPLNAEILLHNASILQKHI